MKKLCFDFDGVIHSYTSGWQGVNVANDLPVKGIKETIDNLIDKGYEIIIYSSRCSNPNGRCCIADYCCKYNINYNDITATKPAAYLTIDDRCINFNGNTYGLIDKIEKFRSWTQPQPSFNMKSLNTYEVEGKYLLAALSILTTSDFTCKGNVINGAQQTPDDILEILAGLVDDIYIIK